MFDQMPPTEDMESFAVQLEHLGFADLTPILQKLEEESEIYAEICPMETMDNASERAA